MDNRNECPVVKHLHQSETTTSNVVETSVSNTNPEYRTIKHFHDSCEISDQHSWIDCPFMETTSENRKRSHKKISNEISTGQDRYCASIH